MAISWDPTIKQLPIIPSNLLCSFFFLFHPTGQFPNLGFPEQNVQATREITFSHPCCKNSVFLPRKCRCSGGSQWQRNGSAWPQLESLLSSVLSLSSWAWEIFTLALPLVLPFRTQSVQSTSVISRSQYSYLPLARVL